MRAATRVAADAPRAWALSRSVTVIPNSSRPCRYLRRAVIFLVYDSVRNYRQTRWIGIQPGEKTRRLERPALGHGMRGSRHQRPPAFVGMKTPRTVECGYLNTTCGRIPRIQTGRCSIWKSNHQLHARVACCSAHLHECGGSPAPGPVISRSATTPTGL